MSSHAEVRIRAHCLAEVEARQRWARGLPLDWQASSMSIQMRDEALNLSLAEQSDRLFTYWQMRASLSFDRNARLQWEAVAAGSPVGGNYSHWQRAHPVAMGIQHEAAPNLRA